MSARQTMNYNRFLRVKSRINNIHSQAVAYRLPHDKTSDALQALYASDDYKRLPQYYKGFIQGLQDGLSADIWRNHVVWMLGPSTGPTRQAHTEWTDEMSTLCRLPGQLYGGHFWTDDNGQPALDRPYTEYKCTNPDRTGDINV